jgi:CRP/FNR family transcriptional regulator, nitrogen fixation regulation protein
MFSDGRRQIMGFYLPGKIFGLEFGEKHTLSAEANTDAKAVVLKRSAITAAVARDPAICFELFALTGVRQEAGKE